jgi:hypothetical protein
MRRRRWFIMGARTIAPTTGAGADVGGDSGRSTFMDERVVSSVMPALVAGIHVFSL